MVFKPKTTDYELSPYTGMTRESWLEAAEYLLSGIFSNIKTADEPVVMPRRETEITYPHSDTPKEVQELERRAELFEGLTRSFFVAAPLMENKPGVEICGYKIREYYKAQVLRSCTEGDSLYVGNYEELQRLTGYSDPSRAFQQTVETCALVICLWISRKEIWDTYSREEKDRIAALLTSFAHANTVPQNWRLFNMLDMAFLHMEGYEIDEEIMLDHAQAILNYYAGDGWYRDGQSFDYYSCWAFQVYAPLWNQWYGYAYMPDIAARFEANSNKLMETYANFFDRDGFTNMWGRSGIYRNAATSAFDGNLFLEKSAVDPGLARRISSGSLLQFLTREDFLDQGIPTLGFYGQFLPLVQGYSCAESPFWFGKAFLCLHLPKEHPFWTEKENNGTWEKLKKGEVKETVLNDSKLSYNTKYPWESTPGTEDIPNAMVESQQYVLLDSTSGSRMRANATFWNGSRDGVLYRRQFFGYSLDYETTWIQAINLADFPVAHGILRVDKHRLFRRPVELTLGAYGFPDNGTEIRERTCGNAKAIILKGRDFTGQEKQLAMTIYDGWSELDVLHSTGSNPDSEKSIVVYAKTAFTKQYGGRENYVMISQVITKESTEDFTEEELFPLQSVTYEDMAGKGLYGTVRLVLKDGSVRKVNFEGIEGCLML